MGFFEEIREKTRYANYHQYIIEGHNELYGEIIDEIKLGIEDAAKHGRSKYIYAFHISEYKIISLIHDWFLNEGFHVITTHTATRCSCTPCSPKIIIDWS